MFSNAVKTSSGGWSGSDWYPWINPNVRQKEVTADVKAYDDVPSIKLVSG